MSTAFVPLAGLRPIGTLLASAAVAATLGACAGMPPPNPSLDAAHESYRALQADPHANQVAAAELAQAGEALRTADAAGTQRDDARTVDHLTYLASRRVAIARETTDARTWEQAAVASHTAADADKARADRERARTDVATARQDTQDKTIELAVAKAGAEQDKAHATDLAAQLEALHAKQSDRGDVITLGDVQFDSNRAALRGGEFPGAANLVDFLRRHPKRTAAIEGFTDSRGGEDANVALSQRRASAVRDVLVEHGAPAERLSVHGYGEAHPVAGNDTATGRQMNRRVEIVLSHEDGTTAGR